MALDERGEQVFGRFRAAIRIEDFSRNTVLLQDAGKPPYAERRREKRVFAPVRIVRTDEQNANVPARRASSKRR